ncbi:hypothetical protein QJS83_09010 [Bdellovibrio sp. 22V]|uniref:hypothetical protein n=1 Tax=Bdellovibrio TaxID=958 RepID=UPI002542722A|nr:hypothetical protein [Bdellovibrio sp. 22V]WII70596.1 hypothetical protein QJS83_09010 [Bdellovibrio sp. 22V]
MTIKNIIAAAIITISSSASLAATKCDHKGAGGLFAHTNPPAVAKTQVAKGSTTTNVGTR